MDTAAHCRCCLARPPDKDLKSPYTRRGKIEVYSDMLKDCFEIHLQLVVGNNEGDNGICEECATRLQDACDFKQQVMQCEVDFQHRLANRVDVKDETPPKVKQELSDTDEDNGVLILALKEELSDYEDLKAEDDTKLAAMLGLQEVNIKRKGVTRKKRHVKQHALALGKSNDCKKSIISPLKISLRALSKMEKAKPKRSITLTPRQLVTENIKHKTNIDNILKYSNCTPFSNKTLYGYVCAYCKEAYQDPKDLREHTRTHGNSELNDKKRLDKNNLSVKMDITDLKCNLCDESVDTISDLKKHLSKRHDIKFYSDVNDYILEFKLTTNEIMNCALCHSTFETFKMLLQHMNGHYRNYICDVCDLGFINKHRLKNHKRTHDVGTFKCAFCDKVFTTRVRKMCHEKYTHNPSARYTTNCPHCDQSFTSYYQRNRHMFKEHNTVAASYKCNICDKSFILKSKLTSHIKKVHLMERNHTCPECGQGFFIKQSLDEHMIKHNGERVHKCGVCHKAYARKKTLREHMRIHNNDRRFKCGVCNLAFVQKCSLKSHMLSNHGITLSEFENMKKIEVDYSSSPVT